MLRFLSAVKKYGYGSWTTIAQAVSPLISEAELFDEAKFLEKHFDLFWLELLLPLMKQRSHPTEMLTRMTRLLDEQPAEDFLSSKSVSDEKSTFRSQRNSSTSSSLARASKKHPLGNVGNLEITLRHKPEVSCFSVLFPELESLGTQGESSRKTKREQANIALKTAVRKLPGFSSEPMNAVYELPERGSSLKGPDGTIKSGIHGFYYTRGDFEITIDPDAEFLLADTVNENKPCAEVDCIIKLYEIRIQERSAQETSIMKLQHFDTTRLLEERDLYSPAEPEARTFHRSLKECSISAGTKPQPPKTLYGGERGQPGEEQPNRKASEDSIKLTVERHFKRALFPFETLLQPVQWQQLVQLCLEEKRLQTELHFYFGKKFLAQVISHVRATSLKDYTSSEQGLKSIICQEETNQGGEEPVSNENSKSQWGRTPKSDGTVLLSSVRSPNNSNLGIPSDSGQSPRPFHFSAIGKRRPFSGSLKTSEVDIMLEQEAEELLEKALGTGRFSAILPTPKLRRATSRRLVRPAGHKIAGHITPESRAAPEAGVSSKQFSAPNETYVQQRQNHRTRQEQSDDNSKSGKNTIGQSDWRSLKLAFYDLVLREQVFRAKANMDMMLLLGMKTTLQVEILTFPAFGEYLEGEELTADQQLTLLELIKSHLCGLFNPKYISAELVTEYCIDCLFSQRGRWYLKIIQSLYDHKLHTEAASSKYFPIISRPEKLSSRKLHTKRRRQLLLGMQDMDLFMNYEGKSERESDTSISRLEVRSSNNMLSPMQMKHSRQQRLANKQRLRGRGKKKGRRNKKTAEEEESESDEYTYNLEGSEFSSSEESESMGEGSWQCDVRSGGSKVETTGLVRRVRGRSGQVLQNPFSGLNQRQTLNSSATSELGELTAMSMNRPATRSSHPPFGAKQLSGRR